MARKLMTIAAVVLGALAITAAIGWVNARATPLVRRAAVALPDWPVGARPVTVALIADIHMESSTMDRARLARIVDQVDALHPDLVVLAGDFIEGSGAREAARALPLLAGPIGRLKAPLGVVAVLGNHDHWSDPGAVTAMLRGAGVIVLDNAAIERGPLAIGGVDDPSTGHKRLKPTVAAMRRLAGARMLIAHSPIIAPHIPGDVHLLLAGHTHCGQVVLPIVGPPIEVAQPRYRCGLVRDPGRTVIVTAGLGTSDVPIRFGAPPDVWLVTLSGPARRSAR